MGGDDQRAASATMLVEQIENVLLGGGVDLASRLIREEDSRRTGERYCQACAGGFSA